MNAIRGLFGRPAVLRRLALASLVANVGIVVTGGAVRLTGSGLGCPTWPHCDGSSYVTTEAQGYHGVVEFTNRTLAGVVGVLAALCVIAALAQIRSSTSADGTASPSGTPSPDGTTSSNGSGRTARIWWSVGVLASIPAQAVLGGLTVLTKLNPWLVAFHFLMSIGIIAVAYQLWIRCRAVSPGTGERSSILMRALAWMIVAATGVAVAAGTVTTGSGPHAGDAHAKRTGLSPGTVAQLHADLVMLLIGLSVAAFVALHVTGARRAARAAAILLIVECGQATIGFVQYFTHLPIILVGAHMLGACLVWVAALWLLTATKPTTNLTTDPTTDLAHPQATEPAIDPQGTEASKAVAEPLVTAVDR